jgi:hypothetical protein
MKTNYERFNSSDIARDMFRKYKLVEDDAIRTVSYCQMADRIDNLDWLFKAADTALVLHPGQLVQIVAKLRDGKTSLRYAVVERLRPFNLYGQIRVSEVDLRLPDGTVVERYDVPEYVHSADEEIKKEGDMKIADIPADLMKLVVLQDCGRGLGPAAELLKGKCPFRDEYKEPVPPCMKGETHE